MDNTPTQPVSALEYATWKYTDKHGSKRTLKYHFEQKRLWLDEIPVELTSIEESVFDPCARVAGLVATTEALYAKLYPTRILEAEQGIIKVAMNRVRDKLDATLTEPIACIWGRGYLLPLPEEAAQPQETFSSTNPEKRNRTFFGPGGKIVRLETLPTSIMIRWTMQRKLEVALAVNEGLLPFEEASRRYAMSKDEWTDWLSKFNQHGIAGLRTTRIRQYRS